MVELAEEWTYLEKVFEEKPKLVKDAIEKWWHEVPEEERDKPILGFFQEEPEAATLTPREMYEMMRSRRRKAKGFILSVLEDYGGEENE